MRLVERAAPSIRIDTPARNDDERADPVLERAPLFGVGGGVGNGVDDGVETFADQVGKDSGVVAVQGACGGIVAGGATPGNDDTLAVTAEPVGHCQADLADTEDEKPARHITLSSVLAGSLPGLPDQSIFGNVSN